MSDTVTSASNVLQIDFGVAGNHPQPMNIAIVSFIRPDPVREAMCTCSSPKLRRSGMTGAALEQRFRQACQGSLPDFVTAMNQ